MALNRSLAHSIGLAAGVLAAVGFYTAAAGTEPSPTGPRGGQVAPAAEDVVPQPSVSFAPCVPPAELEDGACVTHTVVTKVVPGAAQPAATSRSASSSGRSGHSAPAAATPSATHSEDGASQQAEESEGAEEPAEAEHQDPEDADEQEHSDHGDEPGDEVGDDGAGDSGDSHAG